MTAIPNATDVPYYDFTIPSTGQKIQFRPFKVKEQKLLLIALESKDEQTISDTTRQVISNCAGSGKDVNFIDSLSSFDIEYLFLHLHARSTGEKRKATFICENVIENKENGVGLNTSHPCGNILELEFNLLEVPAPTVVKDAHKIFFTATDGVVMKYPTFKQSTEQKKKDGGIISVLDYIVDCIDYTFKGEQVYRAKDHTKEELQNWLENLTDPQFEKINAFFDSLPSIKQVFEKKCDKCGFEHHITLEGLQSFFT